MMKYKALIFGIIISLIACNSQNKKVPENNSGAYMYFQEDTYNAGKINEGEVIKHVFTLENRGKADLVIKSAVGSCGCTVAKYEEKPIAPGKSTPIEVVFNSSNKKGTQVKTVTLKSNATPQTKVLTLECEVLPNKK
jgi:hypothetical protein